MIRADIISTIGRDFLDSNIFELRYNGFSYKEISRLLDVSIQILLVQIV